MRSTMLAAVCTSAIFMAACSTDGTTQTTSSTSNVTAPAAATFPADTDGDYTDAQLQTFIEARREIDPISRGFAELPEAERAQATTQIQGIINRRQMNPLTYDAIQRQMQTDQALAARVTDLQVASVTDDRLRAFVAASAEIQPLTANIATATEAERAQLSTQIGAILDRHNIDSNLYNAIATEAQTDQALAARIAAIQTTDGSGS